MAGGLDLKHGCVIGHTSPEGRHRPAVPGVDHKRHSANRFQVRGPIILRGIPTFRRPVEGGALRKPPPPRTPAASPGVFGSVAYYTEPPFCSVRYTRDRDAVDGGVHQVLAAGQRD